MLYWPWTGAISYGTRFLVDVLPIMCYLICDALDRLFSGSGLFSNSGSVRRSRLVLSTLFALCLVFSVFVQVVGAFSTPHIWDVAPTYPMSDMWRWQHNQIDRHTRNLWTKLHPPIADPLLYRRRINGSISRASITISRPNSPPIKLESSSITVAPIDWLIVTAHLRNQGRSQWFGYESGLVQGRTVVRARFFAAEANPATAAPATKGILYVRTNTPSRTGTTAKGLLFAPQQPGDYQLILDLQAEQIGSFPKAKAYSLNVKVRSLPQ